MNEELKNKFIDSMKYTDRTRSIQDELLRRYAAVEKLCDEYQPEPGYAWDEYTPRITRHYQIGGTNQAIMVRRKSQASYILAELNAISTICYRTDNWIAANLVIFSKDGHWTYNKFINHSWEVNGMENHPERIAYLREKSEKSEK